MTRVNKTNRRIHNGSKTRLYTIWVGIKKRCYYKKHVHYKRYGGRGIIMCEIWKKDFTTFRDWALISGYSDNLSIDRINNNKGYCPSNCRWTTQSEQANNRTKTIKYKGESATKASKRLGGSGDTVCNRIRSGWPIKKAFTTPIVVLNKKIIYKNETASQASLRLGGERSLVAKRINKRGWPIKKAFTTPIKSSVKQI